MRWTEYALAYLSHRRQLLPPGFADVVFGSFSVMGISEYVQKGKKLSPKQEQVLEQALSAVESHKTAIKSGQVLILNQQGDYRMYQVPLSPKWSAVIIARKDEPVWMCSFERSKGPDTWLNNVIETVWYSHLLVADLIENEKAASKSQV